MTDAAQFERLASSVLRTCYPAVYGNLAHPGVSPVSAKTVKAPFDNVGWVQKGAESRFVCVAHTTCEQSSLAGKWLHDPSTVRPRRAGAKPTQEAGDLVKGLQHIAQLRADCPELNVTFALSTNREPSLSVRVDAERLAAAHGIELDIWSASRIAQFLDTSPDGQVIRQQFFGAPVEQVSSSLLVLAGIRSMQDYLQLPLQAELVLRASISIPSKHALILGPSGMGKSTIGAQLLRDWLERKRPAIVLKHEIVQTATALDDAVERELRRQFPNLEARAGERTLAICTEGSPLLVLVEDVNRSEQPLSVLNKLLSWARMDRLANWRLVCPVWPRILDAIENKREALKGIDVVEVGPYTDEEARQAIERREATAGRQRDEGVVNELASSLGNDPLLIGLCNFGSQEVSRDVIRSYVDERSIQIAVSTGLMKSEVDASVDWLIEGMLIARELAPRWAELKAWAGSSEHIPVLRTVMQYGTVLRVSEGERVASRHDRVLSYLVSRVAAARMQVGDVEVAYLQDPFFAESIGAAAVIAQLPEQSLLDVMRMSPAVAFYALKSATEERSAYAGVAMSTARLWLQQPQTQADSAFLRRSVAASVLAEFDSPHVLSLTSLFPASSQRHYFVLAARLRNGDVEAGLAMLATYELGSAVKGQRELFARAIRNEGNRARDLIAKVLYDAAENDRRRLGALHFAGYLGAQELAQAIRYSWSVSKRPDIAYYLWAAGRCCGLEADETLGPVVDAWEALPDESTDGPSIYDVAAYSVRSAYRVHPPSLETIDYLVARANNSQRLAWPIAYLLKSIDHPKSAEYVVRYVARRMSEGHGVQPGLYETDWGSHFRNERRLMSNQTKERLLALALGEQYDPHLREAAFEFWEAGTADNDVNVARKIEPGSVLYRRALWARVSRRDSTAFGELTKMIDDKPSYWLQGIRFLLPEEFIPVLAQVMDKLAATPHEGDAQWTASMVAEALLRIDLRQAEVLLVERWNALGTRDTFIQVALALATPKLQALVAESVNTAVEPKVLFKYFVMHIGSWTQQMHGFTRLDQIYALLPFLRHFSERDLLEIWEACTINKWLEIRTQEIDPLVKGLAGRRGYLPGEPVSTGDLDRAILSRSVWTHEWVDQQVRRGASRSSALASALDWASAKSTPDCVQLVCNIFAEEATRAELAMLEQFANAHPELQIDIGAAQFAIFRRTLV